MPREAIDQTLDTIRQLGDKLGYPTDRVEAAINDRAGNDLELRALRRRWAERARSLDHRFAREVRQQELARWAREAEAQHGERQVAEMQRRKALRGRLPLGTRLNAVLNGLSCASTVGSSLRAVEGGKTSDRPAGPPPAEPMDVTQEMRAIRVLVELLEDRWDAERGLIAPLDYQRMGAEQKDQLLLRLAGVHSEVVAEHFPWLGSSRTIERMRRALGEESGVPVRPSTGLPKEREVADAA